MNTCTAFCHSAGTYKILSFLNTDIKNVYTNITTMLTIAINEHRMCGESLSNKHNLLAAQREMPVTSHELISCSVTTFTAL